MTPPVRPEPPSQFSAMLVEALRRHALATAKQQMASKQITDEQQAAGHGPLSDAMYANVTPVSYGAHGEELARALAAVLLGRDANTAKDPQRASSQGRSNPEREDAWRLYLGIPQMHRSLGVSDYQPARSTDPTATYFTVPGIRASQFGGPAPIRNAVDSLAAAEAKGQRTIPRFDGGTLADPGVMGNYQVSRGQDARGNYLSYYDIYDLAKTGAGLVGHPYEIYDRVYYDPKTYQPVAPRATPQPPLSGSLPPAVQRDATATPMQSILAQALLAAKKKQQGGK